MSLSSKARTCGNCSANWCVISKARAERAASLAGGRREFQLALDLMQEYSQRRVELVTDEVIDSFFSEVGQAEVSRKQRGEQPVHDFAQRLARRHFDNHAIAPSLVVGSSSRRAQLGNDSVQIPSRAQRRVASVCDAHAAMPLV